MTYAKSLFIFHRDLRLHDNTALREATKRSETVIPCFIFDPRQLEDNPHRSDNAVQFMLESLKELDADLKKKQSRLYLFYGKTDDVVDHIIRDQKLEAVFSNYDYTPFSKKRDKQIADICKNRSIDFVQYHDYLLHEPGTVTKDNGQPYTVYTPFYKKSETIPVAKPKQLRARNFHRRPVTHMTTPKVFNDILPHSNPNIAIHGGRSVAKKILSKLGTFKKYKLNRDYPAKDATTHLSAHNKFGTVSCREVYYAIQSKLGRSHELVKELYWRDFFTHIAFHYPHVFRSSFHPEYDRLRWEHNEEAFDAWCEGKTGFPIVDAGMRQLNATGYMHNRVRMIAASFLTKDLRIDWRWGEQYFAHQLVDYDPCVNNGNWQWAASTGCDAQPYFRVFNPWLQQVKFDQNAEYIKKWIPELQSIAPKTIHTLHKLSEPIVEDYPLPIVNHKEQREKTLAWFALLKK